jgi:hypothetical protein
MDEKVKNLWFEACKMIENLGNKVVQEMENSPCPSNCFLPRQLGGWGGEVAHFDNLNSFFETFIQESLWGKLQRSCCRGKTCLLWEKKLILKERFDKTI